MISLVLAVLFMIIGFILAKISEKGQRELEGEFIEEDEPPFEEFSAKEKAELIKFIVSEQKEILLSSSTVSSERERQIKVFVARLDDILRSGSRSLGISVIDSETIKARQIVEEEHEQSLLAEEKNKLT
jgi:hypothetical protein